MSDDFDGLRFARKLQDAGFTREQAEALAEQIRTDVIKGSTKATALEESEARQRLHIDRVEERTIHRIEQVERSLVIKLGGLIVVAIGLIVTLLKLFGK